MKNFSPQTILLFSRITPVITLLLLMNTPLSAQDFKVVGYFPEYRFGFQDDIRYDQLTHLNFSFLNPDAQGNLTIGGQNIDPVVVKARAANPDIQLFVALAGGGLTLEWETAWNNFMQPANRSAFIHSLVQYVEVHDLDGIDMDLEWSHVNSLYSPFVIELADSLHTKGFLFSAAFPGTTRYADVSTAALAVFDWVNLMVYDLTGPWQPNNAGPHSPYSFAQQSIAYWLNQGLTADRMTLGVPFYGRSWEGTDTGNAFTYAHIVAEDTSYAYLNQVGGRYYNGIPLIQSKTILAQESCSGIMIWEIGQDAFGSLSKFSLLNAIDEQIDLGTSLPAEIQPTVRLYPNPATDFVQIEVPHERISQVRLYDMQGRMLRQVIGNGTGLRLELTDLAPGMYVCRIQVGDIVVNRRVVKE